MDLVPVYGPLQHMSDNPVMTLYHDIAAAVPGRRVD